MKSKKDVQGAQKTRVLRAVTAARRKLRREYALHSGKAGRGGWRATGARFGITGAMAYRIVIDGYVPKDRVICEALGIPVFSPAPVCPKHGVVHSGRCPRKTFDENARAYDAWIKKNVDKLAKLVSEIA